jgi:hypothetical protein
MPLLRKFGSTGNIIRTTLRNSTTGMGMTGLTISSIGLSIGTICDNEAASTGYTAAGATIETITTLGTYAAPTATRCRFREVDAVFHPGLYEFQFADARFAVASSRVLRICVSGVTNLITRDIVVQLTSFDPDDVIRMGMTAIPNVVAGTPGGLDSPIFYAGTATGGGINTLTDSGAAWTSNQFTGCRVKIISGTGAKQSRVIVTNTNTILGINRNWTITPNATSVYAIEEGDDPKIDGSLQTTANLTLYETGIFYSGTTSSATSTTLTDTVASWTVNALAGCRVKIVTGTGIKQSRVIVSNTATVLTLDRAWVTTPALGDTYVIIESDSPKTDPGLQVYANLNITESGVFYSGTATSGGTSNLGDTNASWPTNSLIGCRVKLTGGTGAKQSRVIIANSATSLTVGRTWVTNPDNTTIYVIMENDQPKVDLGAGVYASSIGDKNGYALSAAGVTAVWNEAQTGHNTLGTFGYYLNARISDIPSPPSVTQIVNGVWNEAQTGHNTLGAFGYYLNARISDIPSPPSVTQIVNGVWDEAQSGHTTPGTFGSFLDAQVSGVSTGGVTPPTVAEIVAGVWDELQSAHTTPGTFGLYLDAAISGVSTGGVTPPTVTEIVNGVWDEALNNHLTSGSTGSALSAAATGTSGESIQSQWRYNTSTTMADPGSGKFRTNTVTFTTATQMTLSYYDNANIDYANSIRNLTAGDTVTMQDAGNSVNWAQYVLATDPVDNGGWWLMNLTFVAASGTVPTNNSVVIILFRKQGITAALIADAVWDEVQSGHTTFGTFGYYLDAPVSGISTGGGGGGTDWTTTERDQIRYRLGLDGVTAVPAASPVLPVSSVSGNVAGTVGGIAGVSFPAHFADLAIAAGTGQVSAVMAAGAISEASFTLPPEPAGPAEGLLAKIMQTWNRWFEKTVYDPTAGTLKTYAADGVTVITVQEVSIVADVQTVEAAEAAA